MKAEIEAEGGKAEGFENPDSDIRPLAFGLGIFSLSRKSQQDDQKARLLTRPTLATTLPARPEPAKTASSPLDAPCLKQSHRRVTKDDPSKLARLRCLRMARMSSPLRAANEGLLRPRVARVQGTHRAILPCWRTFSGYC